MAATMTDTNSRTTIRRDRTTDVAPSSGRRGRMSRVGSRQVLTVRGRRVSTTVTDRSKFRFAGLAILVFVVGIAIAMFLSGLSTAQSLELHEARQAESVLADEVTVLERDAEYLKSTSEIARRASELGMVNVGQPAVLVVAEDGSVHEVRPGDPGAQEILDVNGTPMRPEAPTSDPEQTENVPGMGGIQEEQPQPQPEMPPAPEPEGAPLPEPAPDMVLLPEPEPAVD